ncbi:OPT family small oligopeptide transporter [Blakeslea trispora]|nr:OPT family small oligopeptide transporter [Blakeslea trispora]
MVDVPFDKESLANDRTHNVFDSEHHEAENVDIQVVNQLATMKDDPSLPCFTLRVFVTGTLGGWINPGPFNVKEHACIYVIVSSANTAAYATFILSAQNLYYKNSPGVIGSILLLLATQMVGYGIAGQLKQFLVDPANMIWPTCLPTVSLLNTLNANHEESSWRTRFFFMVFAGVFVYEFIPQYMMPILGGISLACLGNSGSVWVQRLFGGLAVNEGLGMFQLSFDWNYLSNLSPLVLPLYVQLNIYVGILFIWILAPLLYHNNVWNAQSFPFLSNSIFQLFPNGTSIIYPQHLILNTDNSLNQTAIEELGRPHFSTVAAMGYVLLNIGVTASITHVIMFHGRDILNSCKKTFFDSSEQKVDPHVMMMSVYPKVPALWYGLVYVIGIGLNMVVAYINDSQLPWYGVLMAIFISSALSLPLNMITAITGTGFGLNVFAEMIGGFIFPGLPVANMYFKTLAYNTLSQAGAMAGDLKIGHYLKVPPRAVFLNQLLGTFIGCIFNYIVNHSIVSSQRDVLLDPIGSNIWNGATPQTINSAAITWAIGPIYMFGPGTDYYIILWGFVIGFIVPIPIWLLHKRYPSVGFNLINVPMILVGATIVPGTATSWITVSFVIMLTSQYYIKRRYHSLFVKYNYLVSTALDSGTSLMVFLIAMFLYGGANGHYYTFPTWWGNRAGKC